VAAQSVGPMHVLSASSFKVVIGTTTIATFSELGGIKSTMNSVGYTYSGTGGRWVHSRQFGHVDPPDVTLKKGMEGPGVEGVLWAWHEAARFALPVARIDASLVLMGTSKESEELVPVTTFWLTNCWPKSVTVSDAKAGSSDIVHVNIVLTCDHIRLDGSPPPLNWLSSAGG
jgi:phage tail-like protein